MLSKIPHQAKPVIAIVGLALAAVLLWFTLRSEPAVLDPIILNVDNGQITRMSHDAYTKSIGRQGNSRRLFPLEATGDGGLQIHRRYQGEGTLQIISQSYGVPMEKLADIFDNPTSSRPQIKSDRVPSWARDLPSPVQPRPTGESEDVPGRR